MILKQFIDKDLGHASYILAEDKTSEAILIDPRRDIDEYIKYIEDNNLSLKYVFNSHPHADYIGGHLQILQVYPDVKNIFHYELPSNFVIYPVKSNDNIQLGDSLELIFLETPGHTPYCISCLVKEDEVEKYIFTGDILFIGDIGRPDLLGEDQTKKLLDLSYESAKQLYSLPDHLIVLPTHIEGSLCGKEIRFEKFSTIGIEKLTNKSFMLSQQSKELYIQNLLSQKISIPKFFKRIAFKNIQGPTVIKSNSKFTKLDNINNILNDKNSYVIDIRNFEVFHKNFIKGTINIPFNSNVSFIAGSLLEDDKKIYIIHDETTDYIEFIKKLYRVGLDNIAGIIDSKILPYGDLNEHTIPKDFVILNLDYDEEDMNGIKCDITSLDTINLDKNRYYKFRCNKGFKSKSATSYLRYLGYNNLLI